MAKLLGGSQIYGNATVNSYLVVSGNADLSGGNLTIGTGNTSVTSITMISSNVGNLYTSNPTVTISAPTTLYGGTATANANIGVVALAITSGGSSYYVGNVLTMVGNVGNATTISNATFTVTSVATTPGAITGIAVTTAGAYSLANTNPVTTTVAGSGGGTGATFTAYYGVNTPVITYNGTGYVEQPTVAITGGGGLGAAAYAQVGGAASGARIQSMATGPGAQTFGFFGPGGTEVLRLRETAPFSTITTQNFVQITSSTVNPATIQAVNSAGTAAPLNIVSAVTGNINFGTNGLSTYTQFVVVNTTGSVNWITATGATPGNSPTIGINGTDANADLTLIGKGTGNVKTTGNLVAGGNLFVTNGVFWANGVAYSTGSTYGNTQVAAYLPIDPTVSGIQANVGTLYLGNISTNANLGAFQTYANATFATANGPSTGTLSANLGAYQIYANANVGTLYLGNISTQANIGLIFNSLNTVTANVGSYENTTNANIGTLFLGNATTQANLGAYQNTTNANVGSIFNNLNTLNANVGAYETTTNANIGTLVIGNATTQANIGTLYLGNISTQANIGAFYAFANTAIASLYTNANANTAGYLGTSTGVYITNLSSGNTRITGGYADNFPIGANTKAAGAFTTVIATGITTMTGGTDSTSTGSGQLQITGGAGITGNLWVGGNLYVSNIFSVTTNTLTVNDPLVYFQNPSPSPYNFDVGFYSDFVGGPVNVYGHSGIVRQQSGNAWVFFSNIKSEPTTTNINWNDPGLIYDAIKVGNIVAANTTPSTSTTTGALIVAGGAGIAGSLWLTNTNDVSANIGTQFNNFNTLNANVGLYENSTNANIGTQFNNFNTLNANVGSYENSTNANIGTIFNNLNTLNANVGLYETTTNANIGTLFLGNATTNANVGLIFTNLNTLTANVGLYETTTNANIGALYLANISTQANLGSYQNTTNANLGAVVNSINSLYTNANANTAAYLSVGVSGNIKTSSNVFATGVFIGSGSAIAGLFWSANNQPVSTGGGTTFTGGYVANQSTFGANLVANSGVTSTSTTTGALVVTGGAGVSGDIYVGGKINVTSNIGVGVASPSAYLSLTSSATNDKARSIKLVDVGGANGNNYGFGVNDSTGEFSTTAGNGGSLVWYTNNTERLRISNAGNVSVTVNTASTSTTTGALVVQGGVGIGGALYTGNLSGPAASRLGVILNQDSAIGFQVYGAYSTSQLRLTYPTVADWDHLINSTGAYTISGTGNLVLGSGLVKVTSTTVATSTSTGALIVTGGAGISGNVWAGNLRTTSTEIALGSGAATTTQGYGAIAIGSNAGQTGQLAYGIAIGFSAGSDQDTDSIAIGRNAGTLNQGVNAIAIGQNAGDTNQPANSIILNASGSAQNSYTAGFYVNPVRNDTGNVAQAVYFNTTTKELTYAPPTGSSGGTPAGSTGAIQYNNGGSFGGSGLTYFSGNNAVASAGNIFVNAINTIGTNANLLINPNGSGYVVFTQPTPVVIANTATSTSNVTGALVVNGGIGVTGNLYVSSNVYIAGIRALTSNDLLATTFSANYITLNPTTTTSLSQIAGTATSYGTYNFGNVQSIQIYGDYDIAANTGFYSVNDQAGAPAFVTYVGFTNVSTFNQIDYNINYTAQSGHTINIELFNYQYGGWDAFATYSGSGSWQTFTLGLINAAPYIGATVGNVGNVTTRLYHVSSGNVQHRTWIDYVALQNTLTGSQGPKGAAGATGATGPAWSGGYLASQTTFGSNLVANSATTSTSNVTGAVVVVGGIGVSGNIVSSGNISVVATAVPTTDMMTIDNTGYGVTTAGTNALQINYAGGSAAVEAGAIRVSLAPGTTAGGTWNAFRYIPTAAAASGVTINGFKADNKSAGAGTSNVLFAGTGYDNIVSYNGTSIIWGNGKVDGTQVIGAPVAIGPTQGTVITTSMGWNLP